MVQNGEVFFIDFHESFRSTDFTLDFLRLKHSVLSMIENWEGLVVKEELRNQQSFGVIERIYRSPGISLVFRAANYFNAPAAQYWVYRPLRFFTSLGSLVSEYNETITASAPRH
jgi:hypothetical protein